MSDAQSPQADTPQPSRKKRADIVKLAFLAVVIGIVGWQLAVQYLGQDPPGDWLHSLPAALQQAKSENRRVLVIFDKHWSSTEYKAMRGGYKKQAMNAIDQTNVLCVRTTVGDSDPLAQQYKITHRPTTLLLSPDGQVLRRQEGQIGETDIPRFVRNEESP